MTAKNHWVTHLGIVVIAILAVALVLIPSTGAQAITFAQFAAANGYDTGDVMPEYVYADSASIHSLTGISDYDWTETPTIYLYLHSNQITSIGSGNFTGLSHLTTLYLYANQITSIESGDFTGLGNLNYLFLHANQITSIESGDFAGLDNLKYLYLDTNQITSIELGDFTGLDALEYLYLDYNQITSIEPGDFTGLGNLAELDLHFNEITSIEPGDFTGLDNLAALYLDSNQITSIEPGDFTGLGNLTRLDLHFNQLSSIESGDFTGLDNLRTLYLSSNQIASIQSGAFSGLGNLQKLYLHNNAFLTDLNLEEADFSSLTILDVEKNTGITSVSLRDAVLSQLSLATLMDGGEDYRSHTGIGELPGITELDLGGVDFSAVTDLSPLYTMDDLTDLWLVGVQNMDATDLDNLLDNLDTMENSGIEGVLYMTQADFDAFNAAGGGLLATWDAETGHHVEIIPLIPGDANIDGAVDEADAQLLASNWGQTDATWDMGDFDGDGTIGPRDASILAANWGHGTSEATSVPEPCPIAMLVMGAIGFLACGWRPRQ